MLKRQMISYQPHQLQAPELNLIKNIKIIHSLKILKYDFPTISLTSILILILHILPAVFLHNCSSYPFSILLYSAVIVCKLGHQLLPLSFSAICIWRLMVSCIRIDCICEITDGPLTTARSAWAAMWQIHTAFCVMWLRCYGKLCKYPLLS